MLALLRFYRNNFSKIQKFNYTNTLIPSVQWVSFF